MSVLDMHSTHSKFFVWKFLSKSGKVLNLLPISPNTDFRQKILKYQYQARTHILKLTGLEIPK